MPSRPLRRATVVAILAVAASTGSLARAQVHLDPVVCARVAEDGQRARAAGRLRQAREHFNACSGELCPALVRQDCAAWASDTAAGIASIVVDAKDADGHDLVDVTVRVDGVVVASALDGHAIEIDPGQHTFDFDRSGYERVTERALIHEGTKRRTFVVSFRPREAPTEGTSTRTVIGAVTIGVGLLLTSLAIYELVDRAEQVDLGEKRATLVPPLSGVAGGSAVPCRDYDSLCAKYDEAASRATGLAIGFGIGALLSLGIGTYLVFSGASTSARPAASTTIVPRVSTSSGGLMVVGSF